MQGSSMAFCSTKTGASAPDLPGNQTAEKWHCTGSQNSLQEAKSPRLLAVWFPPRAADPAPEVITEPFWLEETVKIKGEGHHTACLQNPLA